jgi:hypothetical protein
MSVSTIFRIGLLLGIMALLSACGQDTVSTYPVNNQSFVMEGPLFQGT